MKLDFIKNKKLLFVSPHYDDAALSCGHLIKRLSGGNIIYVVNIFTTSHKGPHTFSSKKFLKVSGNTDALALYNDRKAEDFKALKWLGVKGFDMSYQDAIFRRRSISIFGRVLPELDHIYPFYKAILWSSGHREKALSKKIENDLRKFNKRVDIVFLPLAIGGHVDHRIARRIGENVSKNIIYYSDFPYNINNPTTLVPAGYKKVEIPVDLKEKSVLLKFYKSQFGGLFKDGLVPKHKEIYFVKIP